MANHVDGYLSVQANEEGMKAFHNIVDKLDEIQKKVMEADSPWGYEVHLGELFFDDLDDEKLTRDWMCDNIGAKWAYAREWDEESIAMYSAWSPCGEFAEWIAKEVGKADPDATVRLEYQDEMPNYIGVATYNAEGECDDECIEWDEIQEMCMAENAELKELWDEENQEWKDEDAAYEILWEIKWDIVSDWCGRQ